MRLPAVLQVSANGTLNAFQYDFPIFHSLDDEIITFNIILADHCSTNTRLSNSPIRSSGCTAVSSSSSTGSCDCQQSGVSFRITLPFGGSSSKANEHA